MNDDKERLNNLMWFGEIKMILAYKQTGNIDDTIEEIYQATKKYFKLKDIADKMEYEAEHSSLGDCPECNGYGLKRFAEMLRDNNTLDFYPRGGGQEEK